MSEKDWRVRLDHILQAIGEIETFIEGLEKAEFLEDAKTYKATERNIEIISEASQHIPGEVKAEHPDIPWVKIVAMRNYISHAYEAVDEDVIWTVASEELGPLKAAVLSAKGKYGGAES